MTGRKGRLFGRITHVLFAPADPRAVGYEVQPPAIAYIIDRKPRYLTLDALERTQDGFALRQDRDPGRPDFSWDETVVWQYMPVATEDNKALGFVKDVDFDLIDGTVRTVWLSRGAADDVAVGRATLAGTEVIGFDGDAVRVSSAASGVQTSGGTARQAGRGAAIAMIAAQETAKQAVGGAVQIAKVVKRGDVAKRAARGWKAFRDAVKEGMSEEE